MTRAIHRSAACVVASLAAIVVSCTTSQPVATTPAAPEPRLVKAYIIEPTSLAATAAGDAEIVTSSEADRILFGEGKVVFAPIVLFDVGSEAKVSGNEDEGEDVRTFSVRVDRNRGDDVYTVGYAEARAGRPIYELRAVRLNCKLDEAIVIRGLVGPGAPRTILVRPQPLPAE